eukprot:gnl/MRDRNA2_/MRDRNA2_156649_c0_seq1.p1 gnl/MRDRNA2_/MRDRNA2_156649_c0~~gnl/MRDRNA2_/MRDRNA2_156649_c0_seq1.p1  ORF type:complete len:513 (-),score=89.60 gnl/MRDRNA2_/MRDRNA2_156649_c0_seq1:11-1489(-)
MSVSKTFARKFKYEVDNNQELIALGAANLLGSMSGCYPAAASLSRTAVVGSSGAASPMHNVWTVVLLALVLLYCGPLLENLPKPSLAAIVVMAFKSLLLNGFAEMKMCFRVSLPDFGMWMIAFISTLALGVTPGIMCAVTADILYLFKKTTRPSHATLGRLGNTEKVYRKRRRFEEANAVHGLLIFRFDAPLHFANRDAFTEHLWTEFHHHNSEILEKSGSRKSLQSQSTMESKKAVESIESEEDFALPEKVHTVILDCSPVTHIDMTAVRMLEKLRVELHNHECRLLLSHCKYSVHRKLLEMGLFKPFPDGKFFDIVCFRDLHDAVLFAEGKLSQPATPSAADASRDSAACFDVDLSTPGAAGSQYPSSEKKSAKFRKSATCVLEENGVALGPGDNDTFEDYLMVTDLAKLDEVIVSEQSTAGEEAIRGGVLVAVHEHVQERDDADTPTEAKPEASVSQEFKNPGVNDPPVTTMPSAPAPSVVSSKVIVSL